MPDFIIAYRGSNKPATPQEGERQREKWHAWVKGLGAAAVNPGTPLGKSRIVSSSGVSNDAGPNALSGYSIVRAEDMDAAIELARACPYCETGSVEVAQIMNMA